MDTTTDLVTRLQWALEDFAQLLGMAARGLLKLAVAGSLLYILLPPLWESFFSPTLAAAHELPYVAAKRADTVLVTGQSMLESTLGVKVAHKGSCGPVQSLASQLAPRVSHAEPAVKLLQGADLAPRRPRV